jgi:amidase
MDDPTFASATELVAALAAGRLSSVELLERLLDRIERLGDEVNAFVTLDAARAVQHAAEADAARARGAASGALHGLAMTVKDCFETAGLRTTCGAPPLAEHVPARDADAVALLKDAGAIVFGKTNTPTFAADGQAFNPVAGTTRNPWDLARTPGGSSGGSAAALAAGLTTLELGSDHAGSVRIPASFCGVFGLKPSAGIVPLRGHIPGPPGTLARSDMNVAGPLARSPDDLDLALDVLAAPDPRDAAAWRLALPPPRGAALGDYRLAVWLDDDACPVDPEVSAVLRGAVDALADAGARLHERGGPAPLRDYVRVHRTLLMGVACDGLSEEEVAGLEAAVAAGALDESRDAGRHARWLVQTKRAWNAADEERARMAAGWAELFEEADALLCPVVANAAPPHDHAPLGERRVMVGDEERDAWDQVCWSSFASACGLPAVSAPVGRTASDLPVGIQVVGPYLEDRTAIDVARRITEAVGGFERPPAFAGATTAVGDA